MGSDMGGWAAAEIAVCHSRRLARLILVDAVGITPGSRNSRDIADMFGMACAKPRCVRWHNRIEHCTLRALLRRHAVRW